MADVRTGQNGAGLCSSSTSYGYARVSSQDQHLDRQLSALKEYGVRGEHLYADKASGKNFDRPAWRKLLRRLKPGDVLIVKSIDRLGRSYDEILTQWRHITREREAAIVVLDMPLLDTRRENGGVTGELISDIVLQLLSYVAHIERENIHQRQAEGIAAARARGVRFGRPRKERPMCYGEVYREFECGAITRKAAAARLGVCVGTFDRWRSEEQAFRESDLCMRERRQESID